ncbi:origin recognition complex subunit 6 [Helicoverpa armigera]|uniref:origin recognition complex subunit 6 n=1 Tax=Helicoverpa armigera TaxID=29058 RepID=UPI0030831F14
MAMNNKTLHLIASKLGLGEEEKVLNKAAEYERLLQTKSMAGSNMTDTAKVVICLDLAAGVLGADLDVKTAIKYSGLKPLAYNNTKKVVQNLLELNSDKLTTTMLCLTLQCTGVQDLADRILEEYQRQSKMEVDLNLPQYVCMAVYQACRVNKVKVPKSKVIEKSRLKPAQWAKLDADWTKFIDLNFATAKKKRGRPAKAVIGNVELEENMDVDVPKVDEPQKEIIEPYEDWKKRMLETAYKELKDLEKIEARKSLTPRKSPRKAPQKFSPYKSPTKTNGVRLLFPIDL